MALKRQLFRVSNPVIVYFISTTWEMVKPQLAHQATYQTKMEFWHTVQNILNTFYMEAVNEFAVSIDALTGGKK